MRIVNIQFKMTEADTADFVHSQAVKATYPILAHDETVSTHAQMGQVAFTATTVAFRLFAGRLCTKLLVWLFARPSCE